MTDQQKNNWLQTIAHYVTTYNIEDKKVYHAASLSLMDAIGCALLALQYPACTTLLGPVVPEATASLGARTLGTALMLDPVKAAFDTGVQIRWLDYNDTWLALEWGHPSDNLGALLAISDYLSRQHIQVNQKPLTIKTLLSAMIKAYEIQGVLALSYSFNRLGFDHVILVKLASAALTTALLGGNEKQIVNVLSQCLMDGAPLRAYRHQPNVGSRKSWAAGDASSRAVFLALMTLKGEMGYRDVLQTPIWGFDDVILKGNPIRLHAPLETHIIQNILYKIAYPAEFHAQTAVECAIQLHPIVKNKINQIKAIIVKTHESAMRIINKRGPLHNPADRDHSLQYMVAVALLYGNLKAEYYEDLFAANSAIDALREKMIVREEKAFSESYLDPTKRAIPNAIQIEWQDGTKTDEIRIDYPLGHPRRREEGIPLLYQKFENNIATLFSDKKVKELSDLFHDQTRLEIMPVNIMMDLFSHSSSCDAGAVSC